MSLKLIPLVVLFCLVAWTAKGETLIAPSYPGSIPCATGQNGCFLSKDTYEQVAAFYERDRGPGTTKKNSQELGRKAFYEYMDVRTVHQYDPTGSAIGVRIYSQPPPADHGDPETSLPIVGDVFGKLKLLTMQGSMSMEEYNVLVRKYRHLASWYFPMNRDTVNASRLRPQNEVIIARCEQGPQEQEAAENMEAMAMKAQQLMMQGRQREALELLQRVGESAQGVHEQNISSKGVQKWEGCLEELQAHGYQTKIEIAVDPSKP